MKKVRNKDVKLHENWGKLGMNGKSSTKKKE
jgi:predicted DNA-binding WGR domain protein